MSGVLFLPNRVALEGCLGHGRNSGDGRSECVGEGVQVQEIDSAVRTLPAEERGRSLVISAGVGRRNMKRRQPSMWQLSPPVPTLKGREVRGLRSQQGPGRRGTERGGSCVSRGDGRRLGHSQEP